MGLININLPKPRQFNYRPMYYDERKERLAQMEARAKAELSAEKGETTDYVGGLQRGFLAESRTKSKLKYRMLERGSTLRFIVILLALMGIFYLWQPEMFLAFWRIR